MIRRAGIAFSLCLALAGCGEKGVPASGGVEPERRTGGIVSVNPCSDAVLMELVAPDRIAAISHYSMDPAATSISVDLARRFRSTTGTAEEVIALRPDLVISGSFVDPSTQSAWARAGLRVLYLGSPATIEQSQEQVRQIAEAVGETEKGAALNARIDRAVAAATWRGEKLPTLLFIGGDLVSGGGTLLHDMMERAGLRDAAADYGMAFTGYLPVEHIVAHPPRVILAPPGDADTRGGQMRARLLRHVRPHVFQEEFPRALVNCGGPVIPVAIARMAAIRRAAMDGNAHGNAPENARANVHGAAPSGD